MRATRPEMARRYQENVPPDLLGGYVVTWRVVSANSHPVHGAFTFQIGAAPMPDRASRRKAASLLARGQGSRVVGVVLRGRPGRFFFEPLPSWLARHATLLALAWRAGDCEALTAPDGEVMASRQYRHVSCAPGPVPRRPSGTRRGVTVADGRRTAVTVRPTSRSSPSAFHWSPPFLLHLLLSARRQAEPAPSR